MTKPKSADRKTPYRKRCRACGAVKMQKRCIRCTSTPINPLVTKSEYLLLLAKHRAEMEMKKSRPPIYGGRLRGQPGDQHRRGGVPYDKNDIEDDYNRSQRYD